ncbi:flavonol reductase [Neohortaea acidophila]|uniref:Flavonol reductase n=1 Tax=Neohortaea acidophila TaxID=245834 RepID=A0A6A6PM80_9PEZI|nr:flavonol reductase [Neohortaea acidophila]KAF2481149.1 flavonol reductase [Neohortaea acidophila]
MERIGRQSDTLKAVFGEPQTEPPPYASARSSVASSGRSSVSSAAHLSTPPRLGYAQNHHLPSLAVPRGSLVLVTGANSFQGMHIVAQLLENGYLVRGTVRDSSKAAWTTKFFTDRYGGARYSAIVVPDMAVQGAFDTAIRDCAGVIHVASVTDLSPDPNLVVTPTIAGALNALEAAAREPRVVRFVYTSSVAASISHARGERYEISSHTWNMTDFNVAWAAPPYERERALSVRGSAKMQTEAAIWRWHEVNKPTFVLNTVLPDVLWGEVLDPKNQTHPLSIEILQAIYNNAIPPAYPPSHFVDVQDSATLHLAALLLPDVQSQRIFAVAAAWNMHSLIRTMRTLFPYRKLERDVPEGGVDRTVFREAGKAEALLRKMGAKGWMGMERSVERTCVAFR